MNQIHAVSEATLTALFESRHEAEDAVNRLVEAGIARRSVRLVPGHEEDGSERDDVEVHHGLFQSLADFFMPEEDKFSYAEGLRRGGYLVTVSNPPAVLYDIALDILDDEGAVDLAAASDTWRAQGWQDYEASADEPAGSADELQGAGETFEQGELEGLRRDGRIRVRAYAPVEASRHDVEIDDMRGSRRTGTYDQA